MLKVISLMKRKPGMSFEEFRQWLTVEHVELGKKLPGVRKYTVNVLQEESADAPYDGVSELWFDSNEARLEAFGTEAGKAAGADAASHADRVHLLTSEHVQI
jgi:uncharacterized protein (TIGR02118 family)